MLAVIKLTILILFQSFTGDVIFQKVDLEYSNNGKIKTVDCKDSCLWDNTKANGDLDLEPKVIGNLGGNVTYIPVGKLENNQAKKVR